MANSPFATRLANVSPFYVMALLQRAQQMHDQGRPVIHMEIGEPDFPTPPTIVEAGIRFLKQGEVKYTPAAGLPALRQAIALHYLRAYGVEVAAERIFITPGASGALLLALGMALNAGEALLMPDPCYPCNRNFAALYGIVPRCLPVEAETGFQLTAAQIRNHWTAQTQGVLLASPSNPTGTLLAPEALSQIIATVNDLGGRFFSDEIYHGLVYGQTAATALQFSDEVFVINSFSKYYGMTGWRVGWLVVPEAFVEVAERLAQNVFIATATHSQVAALAAFNLDTEAELQRRRAELATRRDFLCAELLRLGFAIPAQPEGAFYVYADCSRHSQNSFQFAHDLLEQVAVAVTPGKDFGQHHAQTRLRFAYTTDLAKIVTAMQRLESFINTGAFHH